MEKGLEFYYTMREFLDLVKGVIKEIEIGKKNVKKVDGTCIKSNRELRWKNNRKK